MPVQTVMRFRVAAAVRTVENKSIKTLKGHNRKYRNYSGRSAQQATDTRIECAIAAFAASV